MFSDSGGKGFNLKRDYLKRLTLNHYKFKNHLIKTVSTDATSSPRCSSPSRGQTWRINLSQRRCSCIIPVLPASLPLPQMSGLFFPLLSSKRLRRLYFCKSLSCGQQSEMPAFLSPPRLRRLNSLSHSSFYFHTFTSSSPFYLMGDLI